jgi:hypothetical protein
MNGFSSFVRILAQLPDLVWGFSQSPSCATYSSEKKNSISATSYNFFPGFLRTSPVERIVYPGVLAKGRGVETGP